jgi:hypothetical protein
VWFTDNPQIFNKIYPKVLERLEADFEREKQLREANRDKRLAKTKQKKMAVEEVKQHVREKLDLCQKGFANPWKEWHPKEFCEKDVIIFGQLKKK